MQGILVAYDIIHLQQTEPLLFVHLMDLAKVVRESLLAWLLGFTGWSYSVLSLELPSGSLPAYVLRA